MMRLRNGQWQLLAIGFSVASFTTPATAAPLGVQAAGDDSSSGVSPDDSSSSPSGAATGNDGTVPVAKPGAFPRIADDEETIYAVQRKAYLVKDKLELTPMFTASFTDRFVQTFGGAASVSYHVAENFALEAFGSVLFPTESGLTREILQDEKLQPEVAKLTQMLWTSGLGVQWSPVYGKVQLFGASLGNFNFYVGAGAGLGMTRVRCNPTHKLDPNRGYDPAICPDSKADPEPGELNEVYAPSSLTFMGVFSSGVRFYFSNSIGLKVEVRDYLFPARVYEPPEGTGAVTQQTFTDAIRNNIFINLGVSFLLGGEEN